MASTQRHHVFIAPVFLFWLLSTRCGARHLKPRVFKTAFLFSRLQGDGQIRMLQTVNLGEHNLKVSVRDDKSSVVSTVLVSVALVGQDALDNSGSLTVLGTWRCAARTRSIDELFSCEVTVARMKLVQCALHRDDR